MLLRKRRCTLRKRPAALSETARLPAEVLKQRTISSFTKKFKLYRQLTELK